MNSFWELLILQSHVGAYELVTSRLRFVAYDSLRHINYKLYPSGVMVRFRRIRHCSFVLNVRYEANRSLMARDKVGFGRAGCNALGERVGINFPRG